MPEKAQQRTVFVCQQCGYENLRWMGRCPSCGEWNSLVETAAVPQTGTRPSKAVYSVPVPLSQVTTKDAPRLVFPLAELNRVLGGGLVPASLVLISGDPGIGKSTLLLQTAQLLASSQGKVLYVSGEESVHQIKVRAERLHLEDDSLLLLAETELERILEVAEGLAPRLLIIDSIQAVHLEGVPSAAGSVTQVRECALRLMNWAKASGVPVFLAGHVTKDGAIAGPRVLEHIVDVVLYLEGEAFSSYRLLRSVKNRFGSINEVGIFEMRDAGLVEVPNPSEVFLSERREDTIGSAIVPTMEGSRPLLVEIQALASPTPFGLPRRTANGVDFNRLLLLVAVLSKKTGLALSNQDILVNVAGGLKVAEPAADLGIALAVASSFRDRPLEPHTTVMGEVGLGGEVRAVSQLDRRIGEAAKLGFRRCLVPQASYSSLGRQSNVEVIPVDTLRQAMEQSL